MSRSRIVALAAYDNVDESIIEYNASMTLLDKYAETNKEKLDRCRCGCLGMASFCDEAKKAVESHLKDAIVEFKRSLRSLRIERSEKIKQTCAFLSIILNERCLASSVIKNHIAVFLDEEDVKSIYTMIFSSLCNGFYNRRINLTIDPFATAFRRYVNEHTGTLPQRVRFFCKMDRRYLISLFATRASFMEWMNVPSRANRLVRDSKCASDFFRRYLTLYEKKQESLAKQDEKTLYQRAYEIVLATGIGFSSHGRESPEVLQLRRVVEGSESALACGAEFIAKCERLVKQYGSAHMKCDDIPIPTACMNIIALLANEKRKTEEKKEKQRPTFAAVQMTEKEAREESRRKHLAAEEKRKEEMQRKQREAQRQERQERKGRKNRR